MTEFATGPVPALSLSPSSSHLAAACGHDHLAVLSVPPLESSPTSLPPASNLHPLPAISSISFPSETTIYAASSRGTLTRLSTTPKLAEAYTIPAAHGGDELTGVAAVSDTSSVATSGKDGTVRVWDAETKQTIARLTGHRYEVRDVALASSSDGNTPVTLVASAGRDKTVRLWDVRAASSSAVHVFKGHAGWVHAVAMCATPSPILLSCAGDKTVRVWDLTKMAERSVMKGHEYRVWDVAVERHGKFAVSGSTDASVRAWKLGEGEGDCIVLEGHRDSVLCVDVGRTVVSGCEDGGAFVWDCGQLWGGLGSNDGGELLLIDAEDPIVHSVEGNGDVPKQLDSEPLVIEKVLLQVKEEVAKGAQAVELPTAQKPLTPQEPSTPLEPQSPMRSVKAAASASVEEHPEYDKSAAELVNALKRIRELETALSESTTELSNRALEMKELRKTLKEKDAEIGVLKKQVEAQKNLVNTANVRALLASNPRKADESLDYDEPVNKIGEVSDQLTKLVARLDAMIAS